MVSPIDWQVTAQDGEARTGILRTRRSEIETPVFMPVGTQGALKGVRFEWLEDEMDARVILANTYHLFLRPGVDIIRELGGLHRFSSWNRSLLTDSGGFQVFSLTDLRKLSEDGVEFCSHIDGTKYFLSPEVSMEIQAALGSDIVMVFDECPPGDAGVDATRKSLELTARWARRSKDRFDELQATGMDSGYLEVNGSGITQALFGIVQGAGHLELRTESLERTVEIGFDGYAIGGLSVGEEKSVMYEVLDHLAPKMPADAPRYLMGVGTPEDLIEGVNCGVDMFDCVIPTRNGRTGSAFTSRGKLNIRNAKFARNDGPLDPECTCSVCKRYSLGYLRHLYQVGEMNAAILISHHNVAFFLNTMRSVRAAIKDGEFQDFRRKFLEGLKANGAESV
ncbi:MAG TPA: tRNA guanosine(34) transglycosylase Tgt [Pyrinomonadaceae bacterium]|nr:tRNA guanosine(34) transglycosylase Tgt [Chloracidobacterium sp.]MBP9936095.1 tRNA guanosine(34) transglycosylase Tgt [Pyrinomonadaceae bacterium]MBK7803636.1 tRNA guanosine(34) transglycosylase Tgt [Chloracidobacterium sp.]MBK9439676.1 tRNA guanosine(34) transglycosylase Tgt [Chloracidobacterium sp.]MBL0239037.1 tRNA guanosine(34) transglycosylase Tgt [Chloracidobacterium sp.]